jgi:hypothetical protein
VAQIGGSYTYAFLDLPNSARIAALGGEPVAIKDNDLSLCLANPSLLTPRMTDQLAVSFINYFDGVNYGFASYAKDFKNIGMFDASLQYINYGTFVQTDPTGQTYGNFSAGEYSFNIGWGRQLDSSFSIGANLKNIYSDLDICKSYGIAVDVGGTYYSSKRQFAASLLATNIGRQLKYYTVGNQEPLPYQLELDLSKKLGHAPLRFSLEITHLEKWDLTYADPSDSATVDPLTGDKITKNKYGVFLDKAMRHVVIGVELMPIKSFYLMGGYNYERRQELKDPVELTTVGFSWGFGLRIKQFNLSYARARYALAGSPNNITISINLRDFERKSKS